MDIDMAPPPYTSLEGQSVTFAGIVEKVGKLTDKNREPAYKDALKAYREFLTREEKVNFSKDQLKVLRSRVVQAIEECARQQQDSASTVLPVISGILEHVSKELELKAQPGNVLEDLSTSKQLESMIGNAVEQVESQMREMAKGSDAESTMYREELLAAQAKDRQKIEELEAMVRHLAESHKNLQDLMEEKLKVIGDNPEGQRQEDAKQALAIITQLTGRALPPSTLLGKDFVSIEKKAFNQGASYDIFLGRYFTGEEIAIKVLRQRVDEEMVKKTTDRFARQTLNWSTLRHDCILTLYGIGVMPSPVSEGEYQLYMVSPYLQNRDVQRYLKKYPDARPSSRLQMISDIARGLEYMHDEAGRPGNGIIHGALNVSNVLIKDSGRAVISGFGHAKILEGFQENFTGDNPGYRYMGPEMIDESILTHGSDIWAWAMTSLEILTDEPPYGKKTKGPAIIRQVGGGKKPLRADHPKIEEYKNADELWGLFEKCWEMKPEDRPRASELVMSVRPMIDEFRGKNQPTVQVPPPPPGPPGKQQELGRMDPAVKPGNPPPQPEQAEYGRSTPPVVGGDSAPKGSKAPMNELGKASHAVVPPPPKPSK